MPIQKISLGKRLILDEIFVDFQPSKKDLGELLKTSRTTIWKWDAIAYELIEDYRQEYPLLPLTKAFKRKKYTSRKILHDTEVPLTIYQAWVLSQIVNLASLLYKEDRVKAYISSTLEFFSKSRFETRSAIVNAQQTAA